MRFFLRYVITTTLLIYFNKLPLPGSSASLEPLEVAVSGSPRQLSLVTLPLLSSRSLLMTALFLLCSILIFVDQFPLWVINFCKMSPEFIPRDNKHHHYTLCCPCVNQVTDGSDLSWQFEKSDLTSQWLRCSSVSPSWLVGCRANREACLCSYLPLLCGNQRSDRAGTGIVSLNCSNQNSWILEPCKEKTDCIKTQSR